MNRLHIANTNFEWELTQKKPMSLEESFKQHPIFLQLQFLPFIYAAKEDGVAVTDTPPEEFFAELHKYKIAPPKIELLSSKSLQSYARVESWGASPSVALWAQTHGLSYAMPPYDIVQKVNSKAFSFEHSPKLQNATLLWTEKESQEWLAKVKGPKVLKSCFGVSGKGHCFIDDEPPHRALAFLQREWEQNRPVIAEPWVNRLFDLSTQWLISQAGEISYLGETLCLNDPRGRYVQNQVGPTASLFGEHLHFLEEHKEHARAILKTIYSLGYFGNVGIDAMVYTNAQGKCCLQPIVEVNARKTMGWAALQLWQRHFPDQILSFRFAPPTNLERGLLPTHLSCSDRSVISFSRRLLFTLNPIL